MSHKTKVNAGGSTPPSVESIIRQHSKARVTHASQKRFIVQAFGRVFGMPSLSRELHRDDVINDIIRKSRR